MTKFSSIDNIFSVQDLQFMTETIGNLIGRDTVIFNHDGIIIAARNKDRIGIFDQSISEMLDTNTEILIVENDDTPDKIKSGIDVLISFENNPVGAFGITGSPKEVQQFSKIVQFLVEQSLREMNSEMNVFSQRSELTGFVYNWIMQEPDNYSESFINRSLEMGINVSSPRTVCVARICIPDNSVLVTENMKNRIQHYIFEQLIHRNSQNISASVNGETVILIDGYSNKAMAVMESIRKNITKDYGLDLAVGLVVTPFVQGNLKLYYEIACSSCIDSFNSKDHVIKTQDIYSLEFLASSVKKEYRQNFNDHIFRKLKDVGAAEDVRKVITTYVRNNKSIKSTSKELNIHKNTVQYKLDRIFECTGYNPHDVNDLMLLYFACINP